MNSTIRKIAYGFTRKHIDEKRLDAKYISVKRSEISNFNLSTNLIVSFRKGGKTFFFRECPKLASRDIFFEFSIKRFFGTLKQLTVDKEIFKQELPLKLDFSDEIREGFKKYIGEKKKEKRFLKGVSEIGRLSRMYDFSIWKDTKYDRSFFKKFGFGDIPEGLESIAVYFIWCMRSASITFGTLNIVRGKRHSFFCAVRAICSRIVAEELGLPHIITSAQWCLLDIDGDKRLGVLSGAAPGIRMMDKTIIPNGSLQREMTCLNALDLICFQTDHGPNNYNVCSIGTNRCSVCAFDNDNPSAFFPIMKVSVSLSGCAPFINKKGIINRPFFDYELAKKIGNADIKRLKERLHPYLNGIQISALICRLKKLKKAIAKTRHVKPKFLLSPSEWDDNTAKYELTEDFGITYFTKASENGRRKN